jgi:hypothetical protein
MEKLFARGKLEDAKQRGRDIFVPFETWNQKNLCDARSCQHGIST